MRNAFLALLAQRPAHGYELKQQLEETFGDLLAPLNPGQVYTTLARLERDGLVRSDEVPADTRNKRVYELTAEGTAALQEWTQGAPLVVRLKDEFFMKLVLAARTGIADPRALLEQRRRECLQALRDLNDQAAQGKGPSGVTAELLVEGAALHLEADLRWLDRCTERLIKES